MTSTRFSSIRLNRPILIPSLHSNESYRSLEMTHIVITITQTIHLLQYHTHTHTQRDLERLRRVYFYRFRNVLTPSLLFTRTQTHNTQNTVYVQRRTKEDPSRPSQIRRISRSFKVLSKPRPRPTSQQSLYSLIRDISLETRRFSLKKNNKNLRVVWCMWYIVLRSSRWIDCETRWRTS